MTKVLVRKLIELVSVALVVSFLTFSMMSLLPGDPALLVLGPENISPENIEAVRADLHLDDPIHIRYLAWLGDAMQGDLGRSYQTNQKVSQAIKQRIPVTLELGVLAVIMTLFIAIPLGVATARKPGGRLDRAVSVVTFGLQSVPSFMMALVLIFLLAVRFDFFPVTGWTRLTEDPWGNLRGALLPAASLAIGDIAVYTRLLRTDMIATLQQDHITLARSKGLSNTRIMFTHALKPSSFSVVTLMGLQLGGLLGGAVLVETIFALPGLGRLLVNSIGARDYIVTQGVVLVLAVGFVVANFVVDLVYSWLDPRIRVAGAAT